MGSSPLARGLRSGAWALASREGIIPARAGFTRRHSSHCPAGRDHPRSRGVYLVSPALNTRSAGSSPLARGLRRRRGGAATPPGIIPARAGFTRGRAPQRWCCPDHPRSRGVYNGVHRDRDGLVGSSPLARGLPTIRSGPVLRLRIIPARAGFTPISQSCRASSTDHPRSRGVYRSGRLRSGGLVGSSPLARGLPCTTGCLSSITRIIPARAGFTAAHPSAVYPKTDHPRSRGVYAVMAASCAFRAGSSPLARGLLT